MKKILVLLGFIGIGAIAADINLAACKGCHGVNWERSALMKSKIVKDLTKEEIDESLTGYKNGTYGGTMKGVMMGQLAKYSEEDIKSIVEQIEKEIRN